MTTLRISDYENYWSGIVIPDCNDFDSDRDDLRKAFHCAIALFHLADWIYVDNKTYIDARFTFKDRNANVVAVHDEKTFANALRDLNGDFELIRGIANSAKHLALTSVGSHPSSPSHAANTIVQSTGVGVGPVGRGPVGGTPRVMLQGPGGQDLEFHDLAASVLKMSRDLGQLHGWKFP